MANLLTNGTFDSNITGWTDEGSGGGISWQSVYGNPYPGCLRLKDQNAAANQIKTPTKAGPYRWTFKVMRYSGDSSTNFWAQLQYTAGGGIVAKYHTLAEELTWYTFDYPANIALQELKARFSNVSAGTYYFYVDTVGLYVDEPPNFSGLVGELQKRRQDPASVKHHVSRYEFMLNRAIQDAPMKLWQPQVDVSVSTVAKQRRYALSLTGLTQPNQVRRVWMDDVSDYDLALGRWQVEDDGGTLTLVLDSDPPEAGRVLSVEYLAPPSALVYSWDSTTLDVDWLLARAMSLLLLEADPAIEDPNYLAQQLNYWDTLRQNRERELINQIPRPSQTFRSTPWSNYVK